MPNQAFDSGVVRTLLRWARAIFTPLSLLIIGTILWQNRSGLAEVSTTTNAAPLLGAALLWICCNLLSPLVTANLFRSCGKTLDYRTALKIHLRRLPGKYLPGGIWNSVGRASDYLDLGHEPRSIGFYFLLENFLLVTVTLLVSGSLVAGMMSDSMLGQFIAAMPPIAALSLIACPLACRWHFRGTTQLHLRQYGIAIVQLAGYWVLLGLAFVVYLSSFDGLSLALSASEVGAVYVFSWCIGYLTLFAPQGIGVSEFISGNLLGNDQNAAAILAFLMGFRMLILLTDLLCWAVVTLMEQRK